MLTAIAMMIVCWAVLVGAIYLLETRTRRGKVTRVYPPHK